MLAIMKFNASRFAYIVILLIATASVSFAQEDGDFKQLFNGKDLTGWDGDPRLWTVKDGVIHGETTKEKRANKNTFLIWKGGEPKDFELKLSFRCNAVNNSGIQYRSRSAKPAGDNKWRVKGYQHEIRNENKFPNVPGFIFDEGGKRGRLCLAGEKAEWTADGKQLLEKLLTSEQIRDLIKIDQWNDVRIIAKGNHIQHFLNGELYLDFTDKHPKLASQEGLIALQLHQGKPMWAEFKDIMLREFSGAEDAGANDAETRDNGSATSKPGQAMNVWPDLAPGETTAETGTVEPDRPNEKRRVTRIGKVTKPTFTFYPAKKPNGSAVLVLPGGGFRILAADLEGTEIADWLNQNGYHAFVLHYRVSPDKGAEMKRVKAIQDAQRTVSIIRSKAEQYGISEGKLGVIGFSAGGYTAARLLGADGSRQYKKVDAADEQPAKVDFGLLLYPAVKGIEPGHQFPPTFIVHTHDDYIPAGEIAMFYAGLKKAKVPAELHIYSSGGHGYGLRPREGSNVSTWTNHAESFLKMHAPG